jgi:ribosomal protein L7/L12
VGRVAESTQVSVTILVAVLLAVCMALLAARSGGERISMTEAGSYAEDSERIAEHLVAGRKIAAIKLYREEHGVGLLEAKEAVERLAQTFSAS